MPPDLRSRSGDGYVLLNGRVFSGTISLILQSEHTLEWLAASTGNGRRGRPVLDARCFRSSTPTRLPETGRFCYDDIKKSIINIGPRSEDVGRRRGERSVGVWQRGNQPKGSRENLAA